MVINMSSKIIFTLLVSTVDCCCATMTEKSSQVRSTVCEDQSQSELFHHLMRSSSASPSSCHFRARTAS